MRRIQNSVLHLSILACLTVGGLAVNSAASAACTGGTNTCYGTNTLVSNTTGTGNSAFGYNALRSNTIGNSNTANGYQALYSNVNGYENIAIGFEAMYRNTGGYWNTASGYSALRVNTTGVANTASGRQVLDSNTTGSYNTASGISALDYNTTGSYNTAFGSYALRLNTTGQNNTATGYTALRNSTGNNNTANGDSSLFNATTGWRNVAVGWRAGLAVTTGSDNIIIGAGTEGLAADAGVIRIGASAYQKKAFIAGIRGVTTGSTTASTVFIDVNGQLGTIKSSRRFKEDIQPLGDVSERLFGLRPVSFRYKQAYDDGSKPVQYGLIAEEVAEVFPELVVYGEDGKPETVAYHVLATLLLNEVQKERRVVDALRRDNGAQAARMAALEQQVAVLAKAAERAEKDRMVASAK